MQVSAKQVTDMKQVFCNLVQGTCYSRLQLGDHIVQSQTKKFDWFERAFSGLIRSTCPRQRNSQVAEPGNIYKFQSISSRLVSRVLCILAEALLEVGGRMARTLFGFFLIFVILAGRRCAQSWRSLSNAATFRSSNPRHPRKRSTFHTAPS